VGLWNHHSSWVVLKVKLATKTCRLADGNKTIVVSKVEATFEEVLEALDLSMHDWLATGEVLHELSEDAALAVHLYKVIFDFSFRIVRP
jgi:hypothetical protein